MAYHIDESLLPAIDTYERATIEKYGFHVRDDAGRFQVIDPIVMKTDKKRATRTGGNLRALLLQAVDVREGLKSDSENVVSLTDEKAKRVKLPAEVPDTIDDPELDNSGSRERNRKEKQTKEKVKKDNRYIKVARVLVLNENATIEDVCKLAGVNASTAGYSIEAFHSIKQVLKDAGMLVSSKPVKKQEAEKTAEDPGLKDVLDAVLPIEPETPAVDLWSKKDLRNQVRSINKIKPGSIGVINEQMEGTEQNLGA